MKIPQGPRCCERTSGQPYRPGTVARPFLPFAPAGRSPENSTTAFPAISEFTQQNLGISTWGFPARHGGSPNVIIHFERWDFPRTKPSIVIGVPPWLWKPPPWDFTMGFTSRILGFLDPSPESRDLFDQIRIAQKNRALKDITVILDD